MEKIFIGVDPDVEKSGVAVYYPKTKDIGLLNLSFFELYENLHTAILKKDDEVELAVIIEAGWLNKSNWHTNSKQSIAMAAQIGQRTGANHEVGKKIAEMCEYLEIKYEFVKPTKAKLNAATFGKITGVIGRTNQEQRDAAMLVFGRK